MDNLEDEFPDQRREDQTKARSAARYGDSAAEADPCSPATRITIRPHDRGTGDEIEKTEVVKGYEYSRGQFVTFTPDELKALDVELADLDRVAVTSKPETGMRSGRNGRDAPMIVVNRVVTAAAPLKDRAGRVARAAARCGPNRVARDAPTPPPSRGIFGQSLFQLAEVERGRIGELLFRQVCHEPRLGANPL